MSPSSHGPTVASRHLEITVGAIAPDSISLGPEHPTRAGLVRLGVTADAGGVIEHVDIEPGFLHRGAEKLFEVRDYRQVLMLADRHDWQAPFFGELGTALACERLLGLTPPTRATVLRTLVAEVTRLHSHLGFLSFVGFHAERPHLEGLVRLARDRARDLLMSWTGNRLHPMLNRLGGLASDAPEGWFAQVQEWLTHVDAARTALAEELSRDEWRSLTPAPLTRDVASTYGVSGPAVRASGWDLDLRTRTNTLDYAAIDAAEVLVPPAESPGTVADRFDRWVLEVGQSSELVRRSLERAREVTGQVNVPLSKIIKLPDAEIWSELEAPQGVAGVHLVSRGGTTPWRLKLRTPTFANVNALHAMLVGVHVDEIAIVIASMGWTIGDLDK